MVINQREYEMIGERVREYINNKMGEKKKIKTVQGELLQFLPQEKQDFLNSL